MKPLTLTITNEATRRRAYEVLAGLTFEPLHEVVIREAKSNRSLRQNSTFHGWMLYLSAAFAEATGKFATPRWWKEYLKEMFLGQESCEVNGKIITVTRSTSSLNTKEMAEFMTQVDHYCGSEFHIYLPLPSERGIVGSGKEGDP